MTDPDSLAQTVRDALRVLEDSCMYLPAKSVGPSGRWLASDAYVAVHNLRAAFDVLVGRLDKAERERDEMQDSMVTAHSDLDVIRRRAQEKERENAALREALEKIAAPADPRYEPNISALGGNACMKIARDALASPGPAPV